MTTAQIATQLLFASPITDDVKNRMATRHARVQFSTAYEVLTNPSDLAGPQDWSYWSGIAADVKAINPAARIDLYSGGIATPDSHHPPFEWLEDADMIHHLDGTVVQIVPAFSPAEGGARRMRTINYSRAATRARLIERWLDFLRDQGFDGMVFDTFNPGPMAGQFRDQLGCPTGALEGPVHTEVWWATWLAQWCVDLSAALEPLGYVVMANGLEEPGTGVNHVPYDPTNPTHVIMGEESTRISSYATDALAEYIHRVYLDSGKLADFIEMAGRVNALDGGTFYFFQPNIFTASDPSLGLFPVADTQALHRFYLCSYLLISTAKTYFGYHDQEAYRGFTTDGVVYLFDGGADWDLDLGAARSGVQWSTVAAGHVAYREYTNAYVLANADTSYGWFAVKGTYRSWHPTTGDLSVVSVDSPGIPVPPRTGLILFKQATSINWSRRMRARLQHVAMDEEGDVKPGRAVTVYKADGVTLWDQVLYDAPSGGNVVTNPTVTNQQGLLQVYTPRGARARLTISGLSGQFDGAFDPDPADVFQFGADAAMTAAGSAAPVLTITSTVGGSGGNKGLQISNADGTLALEVKPHGVAGAAATEVGLIAPVLVIRHTNTRPRIYADLSAVSGTDRLLIASSVANGNSDLGVAPNGTGGQGALTVWARGDPTSSEAVRLRAAVPGAVAALESLGVGQTAQDITLNPNQVEKFRVAVNGNVQMPAAGLATNATTGFFYINSSAGAPVGAPGATAGTVPLHYDRSGNRLYAYVGSWRSVALT